jgi:hypothetical protein
MSAMGRSNRDDQALVSSPWIRSTDTRTVPPRLRTLPSIT